MEGDAVITKHDLEAAIAECQGKRNPDSKTCIMLAAFYTIQREMFGTEAEHSSYSYAPAPGSAPVRKTIEIESESEFARAVSGKDADEVMPIVDELMDALRVLQPRLYNAVLMKLA